MKLNIKTPKWAEEFLQPHRYKGAYGGRGTGKSHFFAELLVEETILNPDLKVVCIREVQQTLNHSVKALIEGKIESLGVGHYFEVQTACIKSTKGDGIIIFQGMNNHTADSIKSLEGFDRAFVEEAQSLSQRSLDLLRPTLRKEGSELWFAWNPRFATDPIDVFLRGGDPPPDSVVSKVTYMDNPWFPNVLKEEMEYDRGRDPDKFAHVWMGEYEQASEARIFKNWSVDEFETDKEAIFRFGADWGYSVDPTVLVRSYVMGRTLFIDYEAYQVGCEIDDTPDLFLTIPGAEKWPIIADSSSPERISHMKKKGFNIIPARKGPKSIEEGISFLQSYDIVVHPRCVHTIDELTHYKYKTDPLTDLITPVIEDKNNHVLDSLRYSCEAERRLKKGKSKATNIVPIPSVRKFNR